ncbi:septal ring lytic transglycosylase RlpA family protein [soil metagenome]
MRVTLRILANAGAFGGLGGMVGRPLLRVAVAAIAAALLASCSMTQPPSTARSKEYFSEARYGSASPRVADANDPVRKGGGVYTVGRPYRVAGRTYIPRDNPRYSATGLASWYGSAFHGRLTANGEVYDLHAMTAAHPTMPLPSYARVTNLANGRSVIVRVNDRGPFAEDRIIDVSSAAADVLAFKDQGTAQVKVDYVGPAQMDGLDNKMLVASYRENGRKPAPFGMAPQQPVVASYAVAASLPQPMPPRPRQVQPDFSQAGPLVLTPANAPSPAYGSTAAYAGDPLAPLILRSNAFRSYAAEPVQTPAQKAAAGLSAAGSNPAFTQGAAHKPAGVPAVAGATAGILQSGSFSR